MYNSIISFRIIYLSHRADVLFEEGRKLREQIMKGNKATIKRRKKPATSGLVKAKKTANAGSIRPGPTAKSTNR